MPDKPSRPHTLPLDIILLAVIGIRRREELLPTIHSIRPAIISIALEEEEETYTRAGEKGMDEVSPDAVMVTGMMCDAAADPPPSTPPPAAGRDGQVPLTSTKPWATWTQTECGVGMNMASIPMVAGTMLMPMMEAVVPMMIGCTG